MKKALIALYGRGLEKGSHIIESTSNRDQDPLQLRGGSEILQLENLNRLF